MHNVRIFRQRSVRPVGRQNSPRARSTFRFTRAWRYRAAMPCLAEAARSSAVQTDQACSVRTRDCRQSVTGAMCPEAGEPFTWEAAVAAAAAGFPGLDAFG